MQVLLFIINMTITVGEVTDTSAIIRSYLVLWFTPKYCLGHPDNYLFIISNKVFLESKHPSPKQNKKPSVVRLTIHWL